VDGVMVRHVGLPVFVRYRQRFARRQLLNQTSKACAVVTPSAGADSG